VSGKRKCLARKGKEEGRRGWHRHFFLTHVINSSSSNSSSAPGMRHWPHLVWRHPSPVCRRCDRSERSVVRVCTLLRNRHLLLRQLIAGAGRYQGIGRAWTTIGAKYHYCVLSELKRPFGQWGTRRDSLRLLGGQWGQLARESGRCWQRGESQHRQSWGQG
jgi:hypothetical protein